MTSLPNPVKRENVEDASASQWTPQSVVASLPAHLQPPATPGSSPIAFFHLLTRLKTTKREGWRRFGISHGESISDHMYRMSVLTMLAPASLRSSINIERATKLALVHDMAELLVGDITPVDGVSKDEKNRREALTMDYLCHELLGSVDGGEQGRELREVWQEYEDGQSEESKFVHDVDKMELILQMFEYEQASIVGDLHPPDCRPLSTAGVQLSNDATVAAAAAAAEKETAAAPPKRAAPIKGEPLDLGEFTWVADRIQSREVKAWADEVLLERKRFWEARGDRPQA